MSLCKASLCQLQYKPIPYSLVKFEFDFVRSILMYTGSLTPDGVRDHAFAGC